VKRSIPQSVYEVRTSSEEVDLVAIGSHGGGCHGDSGGGAFIQLSDGTWRLFGVAEALFDPKTVPEIPAGDDDGICGTGTTYSLLADRLTWIEHVIGDDVTPCFSSAGQWDPGPQCGVLPLQPGHGHGTWAQGCAPGPPTPSPPDDGSTTEGGAGSESGSSSGSAETSSGDTPPTTGAPPNEPPKEEPTDPPSARLVDRSCSLGAERGGWLLFALLLLFVPRRNVGVTIPEAE